MKNFETYFEIELKDQEHNIITNRLAIGEEYGLVKYYNGKDFLEEIPLEKIQNIFLKVFGPMNSFGSNCGEIKERIY